MIAIIAGIGLHAVFANAASVGPPATIRWIVWTWLILAGTWWTVALLRSLKPPRRIVLPTILIVVLLLCAGLPAGTWATFMVNHAAPSGAQFDTAAASEFFLNAFSRYREQLDTEGGSRFSLASIGSDALPSSPKSAPSVACLTHLCQTRLLLQGRSGNAHAST